MSMTPKKSTRAKQIVGFLIALAVIVRMVVPLYHFTGPVYDSGDYYSLDDGWKVNAHGKDYEDVVLSEQLFEMFNKGDVMTLTRQLPEDLDISNAELQLYSVHSVIDVYLDEEQIYTYGWDYYNAGKMLGYGYNYIELPKDYPGKELKVVFTVTERNAFEGIPAMEIHNGSNALRVMLSEQRVNLVIVGFLIMFGLIGMLISLVMILRNGAFRKTFCITAFSFLAGLWTFCNGDLITLFVTDLKVKVFMEYTSFYVMLLPFLGYFYDNFREKAIPKALRAYYYSVLALDVVFLLVVFGLQAANITHFPTFVSSQHVMMVLAIIVVLAAAISDAKIHHTLFTPLGFGFGIAVIIAAVELIHFNLSRYIVGFAENKYNSHMQIAALIIVATLFFDFGHKVTDHMYEDAQTKLLQKLAYMDELTQLANRRKCDEVLDGLDGDYAIVSLDMNCLKHINDTYGHDVGDKALKAFANCLGRAFPNEATVGRTGGDEFMAILPGTEGGAAGEYVEQMNQLIQRFNEKGEEVFTLSAAWGIATGTATDNPREIYSDADAKMYECKRLQKKAMHNNQQEPTKTNNS